MKNVWTMDTINKKYLPIASAYPFIKVAWFISKQLHVNLSQTTTSKGKISFFEYFSDDQERIGLYSLQQLSIKYLKNFDYLLVLENIHDFDIQSLRDAHFINFITELDLSQLPKSVVKKLRNL